MLASLLRQTFYFNIHTNRRYYKEDIMKERLVLFLELLVKVNRMEVLV